MHKYAEFVEMVKAKPGIKYIKFVENKRKKKR